MKKAKRRPARWRRWCRAVVRSRLVCPHCGARTGQGSTYFILACILIGLGAGMVGQHIVSLQWESVIEELEHEIKQPFPPHRSEQETTGAERPQDGEPALRESTMGERTDFRESSLPG